MFCHENLESILKAKGISQKHLCDLVGVRRGYFSEAKRRGTQPPEEYVEIWARDLGVSTAYLWGETDDPYDYEADPDDVLAGIPDSMREVLLERNNGDIYATLQDYRQMHTEAVRGAQEKPATAMGDGLEGYADLTPAHQKAVRDLIAALLASQQTT